MTRRTRALVAALAVVLAGCSSGDEVGGAATTTTAAVPPATTEPAPPPSTSTVPAPPPTPLPAAPGEGPARAVVTPTGVVGAVLAAEGDGYRIRTPCGGEAAVTGGTPLTGATVVLDPGHGGDETGAVGANGLTEASLNLAVAERTKALLEAQGATVVLTRTGDYRVTLGARADIVRALDPPAFVSVHHNGGSDGPAERPGTETFFQIASPDSRRLAGLVYEELLATFSRYDGIAWQADRDAGAKTRASSRGGDYYGVLRQTAGVPAVLSEAAFLSNPPEAELLARPEVQQAEAEALARAVTRYLTTTDPGSGYTEAYPRTEPAGPGGGATGCVDPPLG